MSNKFEISFERGQGMHGAGEVPTLQATPGTVRAVLLHRCLRCNDLLQGRQVGAGRTSGETMRRQVGMAAAMQGGGQATVQWHDCADGQGQGVMEVAGYGYVAG